MSRGCHEKKQKSREQHFRGLHVWKMASKAYVASLTLSELKRELKQRGLSAKGTKKDLRDRLEQVIARLIVAVHPSIEPGCMWHCHTQACINQERRIRYKR